VEKVSVVIPTYNCRDYVAGAVESVLAQTYKNIEIIIIDDGSTDNTHDILGPYLDRILYIYQPNGGLANARNRGIREAKGGFIAFLDADDRWSPEKVEIQVKCLDQFENVSMVFTDFSAFDESGNFERSYFYKAFPILREYRLNVSNIFPNSSAVSSAKGNIRIYHGNITTVLFAGNIILPSTVLLKKPSLTQVGAFDERYRLAEETDFFLRYSLRTQMAYVDYPLVNYMVKRKNQLTQKSNIPSLIAAAIQIQRDFIVQNPDFYLKNNRLCHKALAVSYARLAYYYLSEFKKAEALKNAFISCTWNPLRLKSYLLLLLGVTPRILLQLFAMVKRYLSQ